ncbi:MAG TPA: DUF262 domain-containing protein, partial [Myxococcus sp.]|nr:DUF262 domain-containing protein [Myxococcus sp.]
GGSHPLSLSALSASLRTLGFGLLDESTLLRSVLAVRGLDFTKDFQSQLREEDELAETLQQTERALRDALIFLKRDAGVLHLSLLPEEHTLYLLARFFHLYPEPTSRTRSLLSRWVWRHAFASATSPFQSEATTNLSNEATEEQTLQALLAALPRNLGDRWAYITELFPSIDELPGRLQANALVSLKPRNLLTGAPLDVLPILDERGSSAFTSIVKPTEKLGMGLHEFNRKLLSVANHLFHPRLSPIIGNLLRSEQPPALDVLQSHAIDLELLQSIRDTNILGFLKGRSVALRELTERFLKERMRLDEPDRPSLQSLIIDDEDD